MTPTALLPDAKAEDTEHTEEDGRDKGDGGIPRRRLLGMTSARFERATALAILKIRDRLCGERHDALERLRGE